MRAGFWLNLAGILVIIALSWSFITPRLGNVHQPKNNKSGRLPGLSAAAVRVRYLFFAAGLAAAALMPFSFL